jgi:dipeptidyl-peptidase-4
VREQSVTVDLLDFLEFPHLFGGAIRGGLVTPYFGPDPERFCFVETDADTQVVWEVDASTGDVNSLFDRGQLRKILAAEFPGSVRDEVLAFTGFELLDQDTFRCSMTRHNTSLADVISPDNPDPDLRTSVFDLHRDSDQISRVSDAEVVRIRRAVPRCVRPGFMASDAGTYEVPSPNGSTLLGERGPQLALRYVIDDRTVELTSDGEPDNAWHAHGAAWAADGEAVAAIRVDTRACAKIPLINWLKPNEEVSLHTLTRTGEPLPIMTPALVQIRSRAVMEVRLPGEIDQTVQPVGWRKDGSEAYFLAVDRRQKYVRLFAADPSTGDARLVCEETSATFIGGIRHLERFSPLQLLADDQHVLWISEQDGWRHLYLYGTAGNLIRQLTSGPFEVLTIVAVDDHAVFFTAHSDPARPYDVHLCRVDLDGSRFAQLTTAPGVHEPMPTASTAYFLDTHSAIDRPPSTDLIRSDGALIATLSVADITGLAELDLVPPEPFTAFAADGVTVLHGVMYKPPGFNPAKTYPVIEEIYGGPQRALHQRGFSDHWGIGAMAKSRLGFVVYSVDGRGTPERGKSFQDAAYGRFHEFHVEDHQHVLTQLLHRHPYLDPARVGVTGLSWGGYNTVRSLLLAPEHYHVGVAVCPVYDLEDHIAQAIEPYMGLPRDRPEAFAAASSLVIVDRLVGKLLLIHGTSDVNATFSATMKMCDALIRADKPYDLVVIPGADHHFNNNGLHDQRYHLAAMMRYFIAHLQPGT